MYGFVVTLFVVFLLAVFGGLLAREGERMIRFQVLLYGGVFITVLFWGAVLAVQIGVRTA